MPQNIYDDPAFFAGYSQLRRSREGLAGAPEWPVLRSMLPALEGARLEAQGIIADLLGDLGTSVETVRTKVGEAPGTQNH